jgi:hypothetical protein
MAGVRSEFPADETKLGAIGGGVGIKVIVTRGETGIPDEDFPPPAACDPKINPSSITTPISTMWSKNEEMKPRAGWSNFFSTRGRGMYRSGGIAAKCCHRN